MYIVPASGIRKAGAASSAESAVAPGALAHYQTGHARCGQGRMHHDLRIAV
ncbi:MAG: hypothetical protein WAT78_10385 [Rhizobiaceae bacterium]